MCERFERIAICAKMLDAQKARFFVLPHFVRVMKVF